MSAKAYWNLDAEHLPYLQMAANRGLGTVEFEKLAIKTKPAELNAMRALAVRTAHSQPGRRKYEDIQFRLLYGVPAVSLLPVCAAIGYRRRARFTGMLSTTRVNHSTSG